MYSLEITSGGDFGSSTGDGSQANGDARPAAAQEGKDGGGSKVSKLERGV